MHFNVINLSSIARCGVIRSIARYGVIPVKTGIQSFNAVLDPGFRQGDGASDHFSLKVMSLKCIQNNV